jgi:serpin B
MMIRKEGMTRYAIVAGPNGLKDAVRVLELPYSEDKLALVVVQPVEHDGLAAVEARLTPPVLTTWLDALKPRTKFPVHLPRFRIDTTLDDLPMALRGLGIERAFTDGDFGELRTPGRLSLDRVMHRTLLEVSEEGNTPDPPPSPKDEGLAFVFLGNSPFLFLVRDTRKDTILFLGRVTDPRG